MNLLLTGCFNYTEAQMARLSALGYDIGYMQYETDALPIDASKIDATVCNGLFLHHDIERFSSLRLIQLTSAGLDRVPVEYIKDRGILLYNARGVYSAPMAEWAVFRVLERYKDARSFNLAQENKQWRKNRSVRELSEKKVGIIGAGNVGQKVARLFQAFGAETYGFDIHTNDTLGFNAMSLTEALCDQIGEFDIVIITAPLLPSTRGLISREVMEKMKQDSMIVNIARGPIIDEQALIDVLSERRDLFAALDVFDSEPLDSQSQLWSMENVAVSPHNSFVGDGNNKRMFDVIYNNLKAFTNR